MISILLYIQQIPVIKELFRYLGDNLLLSFNQIKLLSLYAKSTYK